MNVSSLRDLLSRELGVSTYDRETSAQAGVAASLLLRQNGSRVAFLIINLSANTLVIRPKQNPTLTVGIQIGPSDFRAFLYREDFTLPAQEWFVISNIAASDYYVLELLLESTKAVAVT